jgi:hypothetical protein
MLETENHAECRFDGREIRSKKIARILQVSQENHLLPPDLAK